MLINYMEVILKYNINFLLFCNYRYKMIFLLFFKNSYNKYSSLILFVISLSGLCIHNLQFLHKCEKALEFFSLN